MGNSPLLWGPNNKAINLEEGFISPSGEYNQFNGPKNYLSLGNFENNATTGWSLFNTTLTGVIPTGTISAGAADINIFSTYTPGQLAGTYSLQMGCSSSTITAGHGLISQAYTIDKEDQAKVLTFKFYYSGQGSTTMNFSGTSSNTWAVYLWDTANAQWVQPAGVYGMTQNSGVGYCTGTFQTASNATSYQLALVCINSPTSGSSVMQLDDFSLGPQTAPLGAVVTDQVAYTPIFVGLGTVTGISATWGRNGDKIFVIGTATSGTTTGVNATISLPGSFTTNTGNPQLVGKWIRSANAGSTGYGLVSLGSSNVVNFTLNSASTGGLTAIFGSNAIGNSEQFSFEFEVPVTGWSSNVQMSNDTDTRVIAAQVGLATNQAVSANAIIKYDTVLSDTSSSYSTSTGLYTVPVSGYYRVSNIAATTSATSALYLVKNSVAQQYLQNSSTAQTSGSVTIKCNAGDTLGVSTNGSITLVGNTPAQTSLYIERLSGPSVIAATESVNGRYFSSISAVTSSFTTVTYATKDWDSHNAYSSGTLKIPVSGKYQLNAGLLTAGTYTLNGNTQLAIFQNGTQKGTGVPISGGAEGNMNAQISDIVNCLAGDSITIQIQSSGTGESISPSNFFNYFSWSRVGN